MPLRDSESIKEVRAAKGYSHRHFTNVARVVNVGNVAMMRSEIVQYYELLYTRAPPDFT